MPQRGAEPSWPFLLATHSPIFIELGWLSVMGLLMDSLFEG